MKFLLTIFLVMIILFGYQGLAHTEVRAIEKESLLIKCPIDSANQYMDEYDYDYDELERKKRQNPIAIMQWYKDSVKLNKFTNIGKFEFDGNALRILNVSLNDAGNYTCKLINGAGQLSSSIYVVVEKTNTTTKAIQITKFIQSRKRPNQQRAPTFVDSNRITKFSKQKGEEASLDCRAVGVPKPDILWFKNGIILSEEEYGITR